MNVHVLEMPLDYGASRHGSDMGPSAIRLAGLRGRLESLGHRTEKFEAPVRVPSQEYAPPGNPRAKYLGPIRDACSALARAVEDAASAGAFPLVLGGLTGANPGTGTPADAVANGLTYALQYLAMCVLLILALVKSGSWARDIVSGF